MQLSVSRTAALLVLASATLSASAQNLVQNPGFEAGPKEVNGNVPGYTVFSNTSAIVFGNDPNYPNSFSNSGDAFLDLGSLTTTGTGGIAQTINTEIGKTYDVSFYVHAYDFFETGDPIYTENNTPDNEFTASFGDGSITRTNLPFTGAYVRYDFSGLATATTTTFTFRFRNYYDFFDLDDVSVVAQAVPEPTTMAALGLGALGLLRRRRKG